MYRLLIIILLLFFSSFANAQEEPVPFEEYLVASVDANQETPAHYFDAQAGDNVGIRLDITQIGFQSFTIRNRLGDVLATGTPPWNNLSTIGTLTIPETGRYFIHIDVDRTTDYEIIVSQREVKLITMGTRERDFLVPEQTTYLDFAFEGIAGQQVIVTANSDGFDPVMTIYAPDGSEFSSDDDSGGNLNARVGPIMLPQNGLYRVVVTPYDSFHENWVDVEVIEVPPVFITYGETYEFELTRDDPLQSVFFEGKAGDVFNLVLEDTSDIAVMRFRPETQTISNRERLNERQGGLENIRLQRDDLYEISFSYLIDATTSGTVRLTIELISRNTVDVALTDVHMSTKDPIHTLTFEGSNTALGTLRVAQPSLPVIAVQPLKISLQQNGEVFATYLITDTVGFINQSIQLNFEMENGPVDIIIEYLGGDNHFFAISVELNFGSG